MAYSLFGDIDFSYVVPRIFAATAHAIAQQCGVASTAVTSGQSTEDHKEVGDKDALRSSFGFDECEK